MLLAYTAINVPYNALLGVLSPSPAVRAVASSYRFAGANAGGLLVSLFVRPLVKKLGNGNEMVGFQQTMTIFAFFSVLLFWFVLPTRVNGLLRRPIRNTTPNRRSVKSSATSRGSCCCWPRCFQPRSW